LGAGYDSDETTAGPVIYCNEALALTT